MENLIVVIAMAYIARRARDKRLILLIILSCALLQIVYALNIDIALYYGVSAVISVATALMALFKINDTPAKVLSSFMIIQAVICLALVPDWSFTANEFLQFKLSQFNVILIFILIGLGMASGDRYRDNC